jgi:hypothetical protein
MKYWQTWIRNNEEGEDMDNGGVMGFNFICFIFLPRVSPYSFYALEKNNVKSCRSNMA